MWLSNRVRKGFRCQTKLLCTTVKIELREMPWQLGCILTRKPFLFPLCYGGVPSAKTSLIAVAFFWALVCSKFAHQFLHWNFRLFEILEIPRPLRRSCTALRSQKSFDWRTSKVTLEVRRHLVSQGYRGCRLGVAWCRGTWWILYHFWRQFLTASTDSSCPTHAWLACPAWWTSLPLWHLWLGALWPAGFIHHSCKCTAGFGAAVRRLVFCQVSWAFACFAYLHFLAYACDNRFIQHLNVPGTQMTLVLVGKGFVLEGWPSKIEVTQALGIRIYILCIYMYVFIKGSLDEKLPSYEVLKMLKE